MRTSPAFTNQVPERLARARTMTERSSGRGTGDERLGSVLEVTRRHLALQAALIVEFQGERTICRATAGDAAGLGVRLGDDLALPATVRGRMLGNELLHLVGEDAPRYLGAGPLAAAGFFIAAPLRGSDGSLYGALCCADGEPKPHLDERDSLTLSLVAELLADDLTKVRQAALERERLEALIDSGVLRIAYQPVMRLADRRIIGFEALSRFPEPFTPEPTFRAAARHGLSLDLEQAAIARASSMLPHLTPEVFLSFNASPEVALVLAKRANDKPDLELDRVVVEITENAAVANYKRLRDEFAGLRERGLRVAIDDAGAGYASLRHIIELDPDFIKLDRSLVHGVAADHARRVVVSSFVLLAVDLGAAVIAEGVETDDDLSALTDLGVAAAQGYALARPSSNPAEIALWLLESRPHLRPTS